MRRTLISALTVTVMAAMLGWILAAPASAASGGAVPAATNGPATGGTAYLAANGANPASAAVEPHSAPISRDSSFSLSDLTWTSWGDHATGTGIATINMCDPDCADGTLVNLPVTITLSDPQQVCGREFFTTMDMTLTGTVPDGLTRTTSIPVEPIC